jgi:ADP-heptose:LPS heptosyltransferase
MERVIVFHPGALGDVILTFPFLFSLHKKKVYIILYTQSWLLELSKSFNFINEWHSLETGGIHRLYSNDFNPSEFLKFKNATRIIALFKNEPALLNNLSKLNVPYVCESFIPDDKFKKHITFYLEGIFRVQPDYQFISERHSQKKGPVVIHPGSGNRLKNWGIANFLKLADRLIQMGKKPIFVSGPAEAEHKELFKNKNYEIFSGGLNEVFKLLQKARLFIGNDSGITHLSAVSGTQTLAIFGASNDLIWKPIGSHVRVIKKISLPECSPCITRNKIIKCNSNSKCIPGYDEVYSLVARILSEKNER